MEKHYYNLGEVILGLREEYRKTAQELNELKKYIQVMDQRIQDFEFLMTQNGHDPNMIELYFHFVEYRNRLQRRTSILTQKMGLNKNHTNKEKMIIVEKNENNCYGIKENNHVIITNNEVFLQQVEKIKQSEFVEKMPHLLFTIGAMGQKVLELDISRMRFYQSMGGKPTIGLQYDATKDTLSYKGEESSNYNDKISLIDILNEVIVPKSYLPEYQQDLINESIDRGQGIDIEKEINQGLYSFNEQRKGSVVLTKVKK